MTGLEMVAAIRDTMQRINNAQALLVDARPQWRSRMAADVEREKSTLRRLTEQLAARLDEQWQWVDAHPTHHRRAEIESLILSEMEAYEDAYVDLGVPLSQGILESRADRRAEQGER